jgi:general secretion pathway protein C
MSIPGLPAPPSRALRHLLILATLGTSGAIAGSGVATLLAAELFVIDPMASPSVARAQPNPRHAPASVRASFFEPTRATPPVEPPLGGPPPACPGWSLFGALVDHDVPERSVAAVRTPDGTRILRADRPLGGATLVSLGPHEAQVRDAGGRLCALRMGATPPPPADPSPQPSERAIRDEGDVTEIGQNHYRLSRSLLDQAASLHDQPRLIPHATDGQIDGVRLYGVRRGSPLGRGGIQNGDTVRAVDGVALTSPEVALAAYARLRSGETLRITIDRGGAPIELTYEVEPPGPN